MHRKQHRHELGYKFERVASTLASPPRGSKRTSQVTLSPTYIGQLLPAPFWRDHLPARPCFSAQRITPSSTRIERIHAAAKRTATQTAKPACTYRSNADEKAALTWKPSMRSLHVAHSSAPTARPARLHHAHLSIMHAATLPLWRQRLVQDLAEMSQPRGAAGLLTGTAYR